MMLKFVHAVNPLSSFSVASCSPEQIRPHHRDEDFLDGLACKILSVTLSEHCGNTSTAGQFKVVAASLCGTS